MTRMTASFVAVIAMLLVEVRPAAAGSCGGGGGDSGSSGGDSGSSDSGGSSDSSGSDGGDHATSMFMSTAAWEEPACVETSAVLGRRRCGSFGEWAMSPVRPHIAVEVGSSVRSVALASLRFAGRIDHGADGSYAYRMTGGDRGADVAAIGADLRVLGGRRWYAGAEASIGGVADTRAVNTLSVEAMEGATLEPSLQLHVAGGAIAGVRMPLGRFTLAGEVFAGGRMIQLEVASTYGYCETVEHARDYAVVIEPRARLDLWVSPWATVGAFAGTDIATPDSRVLGVYVGGHARAFDGTR